MERDGKMRGGKGRERRNMGKEDVEENCDAGKEMSGERGAKRDRGKEKVI